LISFDFSLIQIQSNNTCNQANKTAKLIALRKINQGEEFFVSYGKNYRTFPVNSLKNIYFEAERNI